MRFWLFIFNLLVFHISRAQTFKSATFSKALGVYALSYMSLLILENKSNWTSIGRREAKVNNLDLNILDSGIEVVPLK